MARVDAKGMRKMGSMTFLGTKNTLLLHSLRWPATLHATTGPEALAPDIKH